MLVGNAANILVVLGAGASKSMESKDKSAFTIGVNGGYKTMPLGDQLVQKISEYDKKSLAWLLASTLYQIRSPKCFDFYRDKKDNLIISKEKDFLAFSRFVEAIFPENFSRHGYYSPEEEKKLSAVFNGEFSELFDPKSLEKINQPNRMMFMNISFGIDGIGASLGDSEIRSLIKIFQNSEFLVKKYQQKFSKFNISFFVKTAFFKLLILLLRKDDKNLVKNDFSYESVYNFVEVTCRVILEINKTNPSIRSVRLSGNNLSPHSIYCEYSTAFERNISNLEKIFNESSLTINESLNEVVGAANLLLTDYNSHSQSCYNNRNKGRLSILNFVEDSVKVRYADSPDELFRIAIDTIFVGQKFSSANQIKDIFGIKIEGRSVLSEVPISSHLQSLISALEEVKNSKDDATKINQIIIILQERGLLTDKAEDGFFSCIQSFIKVLRKFMFVQGGLSFPSFDNIDHLRQIFLSSKIVGHYKPQSIDYFMLNLDYFAPYELWDRKGEEYKEMDESAKTARKKAIQKHTKFIISNILIDAATANYYLTDSCGNDYINKMIWIINRAAHFCDESPSLFLKERVKIITFNYESMFQLQLFNRLSADNSKSLWGNATSVYGQICLKDNKGNSIYTAIEDSLWQSIFLSEGDDYFIRTPNGLDWSGKYSTYKDVFGQLSDSMKWIGECSSTEEEKKREENRSDMIKKFDDATDIYFLGFGFDLNNLCQIGLIDKNSNSQINNNHKRKFYVAGGDAKILNTIKTIFEPEEQQVITTSKLSYIDDPNFVKKNDSEEVAKKIPIQLTNHLYRLKSRDGNLEFVVSDKMLPEALDDFGT